MTLPSNVAGRTKKIVTGTALFVAHCFGNAVDAYIFQAKYAPRYIPAIISCVTRYALEFVLMILLRLYYKFSSLLAWNSEDRGLIGFS